MIPDARAVDSFSKAVASCKPLKSLICLNAMFECRRLKVFSAAIILLTANNSTSCYFDMEETFRDSAHSFGMK